MLFFERANESLKILKFTVNVNFKRSRLNSKLKCFSSDNMERSIVDKFMKLSKIGFPMLCFTAEFSPFSSIDFPSK